MVSFAFYILSRTFYDLQLFLKGERPGHIQFLSASSKEACTFFLSPDFHELWHSVTSICLFTEAAMGYISFGMGDHFGVLLVALMTLLSH